MKQSFVLVMLIAALGFAPAVESNEKALACAYSEQAIDAPSESLKRIRLVLIGTAPQAGEAGIPTRPAGTRVDDHCQ